MSPEQAIEKRQQLMRDGFCVVDDILGDAFLQELRIETERMMEDWVPPPDVRYQGQHVTAQGTENPIIQKLLDWPATRRALEQMGLGTSPAPVASSSSPRIPENRRCTGTRTGCSGTIR